MKRMITCNTDDIDIDVFEIGKKKHIDTYIIATPAEGETGFNPTKWQYIASENNYEKALKLLKELKIKDSYARQADPDNATIYDIFRYQLDYSVTGRS